jgi:C1A family cysteine protease
VAEYKIFKANNKYSDLSEQMCIDCARPSGCEGGWMYECFDTHLKYGHNFESVYPYTEKSSTCAPKNSSNYWIGFKNTTVTAWNSIPGNEKLMAYIISQKGWISATLNANILQFYSGGIVKKSSCGSSPNHAIILVGYGTERGVNYWIGRNSWSADWGDQGYFKIERGSNTCGIAVSYEGYRAYLN